MRTRAARRIRSPLGPLFTLFMGLTLGFSVAWALSSSAYAYEVWITDQSDTGKESGGVLYIYDGAQLAANPAGAKPTVMMDLAGDVNKLCEEATKKPVRRPHMLFFTKDQSHIIVSFLSGHVLFMDAATKKPEACLSMGKNVHAAWPTPNQKMAIAANMADKKFIRIWTDYKDHKFTFDESKDVMALGAMESPERPDTAPVCPITEDSSKFAFITLRGGGLIVTDVTETPMKVLATLDNKQVHPAGCGGIQVGKTMYINSGGGWPVGVDPQGRAAAGWGVTVGLPHTVFVRPDGTLASHQLGELTQASLQRQLAAITP